MNSARDVGTLQESLALNRNSILWQLRVVKLVKRLSSPLCLGALMLVCGSLGQAQSRRPASQDDTQLWPEVQVVVPVNEHIDFFLNTQVRLGRHLTDFVAERSAAGLIIRVNRYVTLSPIYLYFATQPMPDQRAYENRLSFAASVRSPSVKGFTFTDRSLFERRWRDPVNSTRYRNRLQVEHPIKVGGKQFRIFISDEVFYDWSINAWTRNQIMAGVSRSFNKQLTGDVYYMRQNDGRSRPGDIHIVGIAFRVRL